MKKLCIGLLVFVLLFSGCAYNKQTLLKVAGDEVNVPLGISEGIKGKGLTGFLYRHVSISFPGKEAIKNFMGIAALNSQNGEGSTDSIDITP